MRICGQNRMEKNVGSKARKLPQQTTGIQSRALFLPMNMEARRACRPFPCVILKVKPERAMIDYFQDTINHIPVKFRVVSNLLISLMMSEVI